jgi:hypothetical protein
LTFSRILARRPFRPQRQNSAPWAAQRSQKQGGRALPAVERFLMYFTDWEVITDAAGHFWLPKMRLPMRMTCCAE